ncbi:hypothetical protein QZH41_013549 [Actinostola sp. cb2023]|nr:hypothetical protein QZH41_013549 [Actinostola sp. cb2023]
MTETKKRQSLDTKSALAQIVLPETLDDIEEFLKPEFPPRHHNRKARDCIVHEDEVSGRRIVMDGFGRWREVRPQKYIPRKKFELVDSTQLPKIKTLFGIGSPMSSRQSSRLGDDVTVPGQKSRYDAYRSYLGSRASSRQQATPHLRQPSSSEKNSMYNSLGMMSRANIFPGIGNFQWNTTTATTFTQKPVTAVEERKKFFGIQTDDFATWSAANVLNERMKKAWEEYLVSVPKVKANWDPPSQTTTQHAKPKPPVPNTKPKKNPPNPNPNPNRAV